ncbi:hypothetical protein ACFL6U_32195, partial [Planctomycetota bacterium]
MKTARQNHLLCIFALGFMLITCLSCESLPGYRQFDGPINAALCNPDALRIILPTAETDQVVERHIEETARLFCDKLSLPSDCLITDQQALTLNLSRFDLIVYGTPAGNRWLATHVPNLVQIVEPNRINAQSLHTGKRLRFITLQPHPFSRQHSLLIYTSGSAEEIPGINRISHGSTDYVIARDAVVVEADNYAKAKDGWTFPAWQLKAWQAVRDLDFMFRTIESVHPNPEKYWESDQYAQFKLFCKASLKHAENTDAVVPRADFVHIVSQACAR